MEYTRSSPFDGVTIAVTVIGTYVDGMPWLVAFLLTAYVFLWAMMPVLFMWERARNRRVAMQQAQP